MKTTTISNLAAMKASGEKFAVITAYDFTFSKLIETAEIEVVLVGDSLGNVVQGRDSTLPVTIDDMAYHTEAVKARQQPCPADDRYALYVLCHRSAGPR